LSFEWFDGRAARNKRRDEDGVSLQEAEEALLAYHSTIWPIATEMAEWLYINWTPQELLRLPAPNRELLLHILKQEGIDKQEK